MSALLPVAPAPARQPAREPDRRMADGTRDHFADSLATARAEDSAAATTSRRGSVAARERTADGQRALRAQLQAAMIYGAMRRAGARAEVTAPVAEPDPQVIDAPVALPGTPNDAQAPDVTPASGTVAADAATGAAGDPVAAPHTRSAVDGALDPVSLVQADSATAAALALVGAIPLPLLPVAEQTLDPGITPSGDDDAAALTHGARDGQPMASRIAALQQRLAGLVKSGTAGGGFTEPTPLLEDHFDAPAAAIGCALAHGAAAGAAAVPAALGGMTTLPADVVRPEPTVSVAAAPVSRAPKGATAIVRDLSTLSPAFRERLERVIDRMREEFGRTVTVVETTRSPERQEALFAQGRTAPGPVVTWTKNSRHLSGLAADLMVDGKWENPEGYADLATVAVQEGLRTLGARDAGHVELPGERTVSAETLGTLLGDLQGEAGDGARQARATLRQSRLAGDDTARSGGLAQVSNVAQVARVATVAQVARVASVARPGAAKSAAQSDGPAQVPAVSAPVSAITGNDASAAARVIAPATPVHMSERITHLLDLQASQAARPLSSVLLRMDNANGIEDQIRIDTRGTSVDARLGLASAQQAAALTDRIGELRDALERRGLVADGVRVQATTAARATDSVNFSRPAAPALELAAMRAAADSQAHAGTRDQSGTDQHQRESLAREQSRPSPRPSSDDPRNRSRREQPEERR
ncbi:MAG: M15 family metallopeptidase [Gemmatimonadaceae bacterium]|nr:M15 family metallopeptidase [Gemmatimonadaceae bacterium]